MNGSLTNVNWRSARLGDVCTQDRRIIEPGSMEAKNRRYLSLEHVESETGRILDRPDSSPEDQGISTTFAFDNRHVLYGKLRPYLNKVAVPTFSGRCTTELIPLLPGEGIDRQFLTWLLRLPQTVRYAMAEKTGSRMPRADMDNLMAMPVLIPSAQEQKRIATILNEQMAAVEKARAAVDSQVKAAHALASSKLRSTFDSSDAQLWPKKRVGEFARTTSGSTPSRGNPKYFGGSVPWVKTGELRDNLIDSAEESVTELALSECSLPLLPAKTLLIAMYGQGQTRGRTGLLSMPATTNQACFAILPDSKSFEPRYLQYWFRHSYQRLRRETEGRGGNQPNLNGVLLRGLEVPLPPVAKQCQIADALDKEFAAAERVREMVRQNALSVDTLPAALLRRAFSGQL